jgi:DNA repair exonuclease SbcCD ATPase subunit
VKHNHDTQDIKPIGDCPGCDEYHNRNTSKSEMTAPIKREFYIQIDDNNFITGSTHEIDGCENQVHVISADWVDAEINKLNEENEELKEKIKHYDGLENEMFDTHKFMTDQLAESKKQVQELVKALEKAKADFNDFIEPVDFVCSVKELEKACKLLAINAMRLIDDVLSKHKLKGNK